MDSVVCFVNTYALDGDLSGDGIIHSLNNWGLFSFPPTAGPVYTQGKVELPFYLTC